MLIYTCSRRRLARFQFRDRILPFGAAVVVIYFFAKGQQLLQCEIHPGPPHVLIVIEPGGVQHTERYHSSSMLDQRWHEVRQQYADEGWQGPFGRDSRI